MSALPIVNRLQVHRGEPPFKLTPIERALLEATDGEPAIAYKLARKIGKTKVNTTIYVALRHLVRVGLVEQTIDGYRRPGDSTTANDEVVALLRQALALLEGGQP